ncbi:DUF6542 domain-containing protein [Corynebacterium sp. UBA2622]|uniref:DUF6542 domain-containing protein n=1 Tax=Corynebacterium sp. UBA2622 TaxID=1946393 RepID=UPI0025B8D158|nr:DUF6542 domain-containing protein [Corynebacterium sp. UBA2622]
MSHLPSRKSNAHRATFVGLPTGSGIAIIAAALFTGALVSVYTEQIGWPYLTFFAASVILVTALMNPKGLFLTVASSPILFFIALIGAGWAIARGNSRPDGAGLSKTSILAIAYPAIEFFPALAAVTVGSIVIALLRLALIRRQNARLTRNDVRERTRAAESNRRTSKQSRRARERTNAVTVEELMQRRNQPAPSTRMRPAQRIGGTTRPERVERASRTERINPRASGAQPSARGTHASSRGSGETPRRGSSRVRRPLNDDLYGG